VSDELLMRKPIIAGNWKCNKTPREAVELAAQLRAKLDQVDGVDIVVCPPFTALASVAAKLVGSRIALGAQNLYWQASGAFTGEVSAPMLVDVGCRFVIVGHSERRQLFGETDEHVQRKTIAALEANLTPIVCIGETLQQREANQTFDVIQRQLDGALNDRLVSQIERLVLAYEPVWAIGTGKTATPSQAQEVHAWIRSYLRARTNVSGQVRIQYGGSVTADNAADLLGQDDIDGALVGGASLKADSFAAIVTAAQSKRVPA